MVASRAQAPPQPPTHVAWAQSAPEKPASQLHEALIDTHSPWPEQLLAGQKGVGGPYSQPTPE